MTHDTAGQAAAADPSGVEGERLLAVVAAGAIGAYDLDLRRRSLWWSPRTFELFGLEVGPAAPHPDAADALVAEQDRAGYQQVRADATASGQAFAHDFRVLLPDGSRAWRSDSGRVLRDGAGQAMHLVGVITEGGPRGRRHQAAHGTGLATDAFVAGLVHELRSPLAPIRNALTLLQRRLPDDAQARWCHDVLDRQLAKMTRLLDDLLDASRQARGELRLQRRPTTLAATLMPAVAVVRPLIEAAGRRLMLALPPDDVALHADPARLTQVFVQALTHASNQGPGDSTVVVSAVVTAGELQLRMRRGDVDKATSLPAAAAPAVAHSDGRPGSRSPVEPAIGFELARGVVELHGGSMGVGDTGAADGAEVEIRLPLAPAAVPSAGAAERHWRTDDAPGRSGG